MIGYLHLSYKNKRSKEPYYAYAGLMENKSQEERNLLFKSWYQLLEREILLTCTCNPVKKVDMTISFSQDTGNYHLRTFPKQKEQHVEGCDYFGGSYTSINGYLSNWKEDENKNIKVNLNSRDYKNKETKEIQVSPSHVALAEVFGFPELYKTSYQSMG